MYEDDRPSLPEIQKMIAERWPGYQFEMTADMTVWDQGIVTDEETLFPPDISCGHRGRLHEARPRRSTRMSETMNPTQLEAMQLYMDANQLRQQWGDALGHPVLAALKKEIMRLAKEYGEAPEDTLFRIIEGARAEAGLA